MAVQVVFLTMLIVSGCGLPGHILPLARQAANEYGGWVKIMKHFRLSHKPIVLTPFERVTA